MPVQVIIDGYNLIRLYQPLARVELRELFAGQGKIAALVGGVPANEALPRQWFSMVVKAADSAKDMIFTGELR